MEGKEQTKNCKFCGKMIIKPATKSQKDWETRTKYCSRSCIRKDKVSNFKGKHFSDESRKLLSLSKKESPTTIRGERHHNWKGGVSTENHKLRGSLEYILWRNEVYKRDRWTCRICGLKCLKGNIIAHHLKKFSDYSELRFIVENGMTLCRKCHITIERPITVTG